MFKLRKVTSKGKITIQKNDSDTGAALAGAVFSLYKGDGTLVVAGLTTDNDGSVSYSGSTGLDEGNYYVIETSAPAGYILDTSQHPVIIDENHIQPIVSVSNAEVTGSVTLTKSDSDTGSVLASAVFDLYKANGTKVQSDLVTDSKGQISVNNLKPGNYYFQETAAPAGYVFDSSKLNFTIALQTSPIVATVSAKNSEKTGSVLLTKTDEDTGNILPSAVFDLYKSDGTKVQSDLVTDSKGQILVNSLKPGNYYFQETSAPSGYVLDNKKLTFTVELQTIPQLAKVLAQNEQQTGSVELTKTDGDTNLVLPGANFSLYDHTGKEIRSDLITDNSGQIKVDGLKPGDYYFQEIAPPAGYDLNSEILNFTIAFQSTVKVATVSLTNSESTGAVALTKIDSDTGQVLAGAIFDLYKADGTRIQSDLTTNTQGQIEVSDLKPGDYYFQETAAPSGYELDSNKLNFTIVLQTTTKVTQVIAKNAEKTGSVSLTKVDSESGNKLAGAIFSLFDDKGKLLKSGLVTNSAGELIVTGLKPGKYYFLETTAPEGYILDTAKHYNFEIEIQKTAKISTITVANTKRAVILPDTGESTGSLTAVCGFIFITLAAVIKRKLKKVHKIK